MKSKIHQKLIFPYEIIFEDNQVEKTMMIENEKDELKLSKYFPEFFNEKDQNICKH